MGLSRSRCTSCLMSMSPASACRGHALTATPWRSSYKGYTHCDVLDMTVNQAFTFFRKCTGDQNKLKTLIDVGLGYITLGQSATTLSGGEAQRVKLSRELSKRDTGKTLYLLDEPTTGLHFEDIQKLLEVLNHLVGLKHRRGDRAQPGRDQDRGLHHRPWPGRWRPGGYLVGAGTPEAVAQMKGSYTGQFLKRILFPVVDFKPYRYTSSWLPISNRMIFLSVMRRVRVIRGLSEADA